ncbi:MAG TPA: RNA-binding cell elongation regulator Jag/EloR [Ilumatobacteraceae bacterium]|nr:RNA-binding cell elongation regulator Jag/EloR [Ilumatobacteraceae bacterium]
MEWVETTGKTVAEAKETALDRLGVADDDAEFEILEEPRNGLFGLIRGEARVRARIRPTEARPKQDRKRGRGERSATRNDTREASRGETNGVATGDVRDSSSPPRAGTRPARRPEQARDRAPRERSDRPRGPRGEGGGRRPDGSDAPQEPPVDPAAVGAAAVAFVEGLVDAFGLAGTTELASVDSEFEVSVTGDDLGLLIGPGGRTLAAVQDLARVAAQRRLGDHETRLRVDVAGYRERRRAALERFARTVAAQVAETGTALALEPMPSADRKIIHDVLATIDGVGSHSEGDDPTRRVVVTPS